MRKKVYAYISWQLKVDEKNYSSCDLTLTIVVLFYEILKILCGERFVVFNDHKSTK